MNDYLKRFRITLTTQAPVHIGAGETVSKKEYLWCRIADGRINFNGVNAKNANALYLPEIGKAYADIAAQGKAAEFERYYLSANIEEDLSAWCVNNGVRPSYKNWSGYVLYLPEIKYAQTRGGRPGDRGKTQTLNEINQFVKDPYGLPYIPGSSLKGALRTIIASDLIGRMAEKNNPMVLNNIRKLKALQGDDLSRGSRKIKEIVSDLEAAVFGRLDTGQRENAATRDVMSAVRISDSKPLALGDLAICQKIDRHAEDGKGESPLPTFRECLKPGVVVRFEMTIDKKLLALSSAASFVDYFDRLESPIGKFASMYDAGFRDRFYHPEEKSPTEKNHIYLGGGSGFYTKTILASLLKNENERLDFVSKLLIESTSTHRERDPHKHYQDPMFGISPHTIKETIFDGRPYEMGICDIRIEAVK
jgi:CRISPR-associated protein Csm5